MEENIPTEHIGKIYLEEIVIAQYAERHEIDPDKLASFLTGDIDLDNELAAALDAASGMSKGYWLGLQADIK